MDSFLRVCGIIFLAIVGIAVVGLIISFIGCCIRDSIDRYRDEKFGICPLSPDNVCDGWKQKSKEGWCYSSSKEVMNCFMCYRFKKERDKKLGLYQEEKTKNEVQNDF